MTRDEVIAAITHAARDVVHAGGSDASVAVLDKALKAADAEGYGHAARAVAAAIVEELADAPAAPAASGDKRTALLAAAKAYADAEDDRLAAGKAHGSGPAFAAAVAASAKAGKRATAALAAFLAGAPDEHNLAGYLHTHGFAARLKEHDQILSVNRIKAKYAAEITALQGALAKLPTVIDPSGFAVGDFVLPVGNWYPTDKGKHVGIPPFGQVTKITHGGKRVIVIGLIADGTAGEPYTLRRGHEGMYMGSATGYKVLPESLASVYLHLSNLIEAAKK